MQITAGLSHPNTVAVYDYGHSDEGVFYYAMEYLDGVNLQQLVAAHGRQPYARVIHLLIQACGALKEAHAAGLVHRDIKPANLMLCVRGGVPDFLKVLDFGLVKDLRAAGELESTAFVGTPLYAAPEAIEAPDHQDARADLYSLAVVGFFLLSGRVPFQGARVIDVLEQHRASIPPSLSEVGVPDVPAELEELLRACFEKQPEARPAWGAPVVDSVRATSVSARRSWPRMSAGAPERRDAAR